MNKLHYIYTLKPGKHQRKSTALELQEYIKHNQKPGISFRNVMPLFLVLVVTLISLVHCDSERNNQYDPGADNYGYYFEWKTDLSAMPTGRYCMGAAVLDSCIYIIGGRKKGENVTAVEIFDPSTGPSGSWSNGTALGEGVRAMTTVVFNNSIFIAGGKNTLSTVDTVLQLDGTWDTADPMTTGRRNHAGCVLDGFIYCAGGLDENDQELASVERYDGGGEWDCSLSALSDVRFNLSLTASGEKLYAIGGTANGSTPLDIVEEYDPVTNQWKSRSPMPTARYLHCAVNYNGRIYVFGGLNENGMLSTVEVYDPATDTWTIFEDMPTARYGAVAAVVNDIIYVIGGYDKQNRVYLDVVEALVPHYM